MVARQSAISVKTIQEVRGAKGLQNRTQRTLALQFEYVYLLSPTVGEGRVDQAFTNAPPASVPTR
jgi:hypothetical protein